MIFSLFIIFIFTKDRENFKFFFNPGILKNFLNDFIHMKDFTTYLATAPVLSFFYFGFLASLLIEINRFYPDALVFPFLG
jgi:photosystem I subunit 9